MSRPTVCEAAVCGRRVWSPLLMVYIVPWKRFFEQLTKIRLMYVDADEVATLDEPII
jgi:hypothetical protein